MAYPSCAEVREEEQEDFPSLATLVGDAATMSALQDAFAAYPNGLDFPAFARTMRSILLPQTHPAPSPPRGEVVDAAGEADETPLPLQLRSEPSARQRRVMARLEVAGVVPTEPLRSLFHRMDTRNVFAVTWSDFLQYAVKEAASAGVFAMVKSDYRAYSHARTRHAEPLRSLGLANGSLPSAGGRRAGGVPQPNAPACPNSQSAPREMGGSAAQAEGRRPSTKEERRRCRILQHVWRGHANKYGGKLVSRPATSVAAPRHPSSSFECNAVPGACASLAALPHHETKDLSQIEFMDGLPTNPVAIAVSCRHRPLSLYSKASFALLKTFREEELGGVRPTMVTYIATSDTLLVYSATDGCVRGFCGLFTTPHMSCTAAFPLEAGLLRSWRQRPSVFPEMLFVAGSYGDIHQIRVPHKHQRRDDSGPSPLAAETEERSRLPNAGEAAEVGGEGRKLRLVRAWESIHSRRSGGILDFVLSDTHIFSCGFDHRLVSTSVTTGSQIVIGHPEESIRALGYNAHFNAIVAVTFSFRELYLWDAKAVTTVPGTKFTVGDSAGQGGAAHSSGASRIIGIECPEDMPHIVTADDAGMVRVWDLRSRMCMQQIRADGVCDRGGEEDPEVVYMRKPRTNGGDADAATFTRAVKAKTRLARAKQLDATAATGRAEFNLSTRVEERPSVHTMTSHDGASAAALASSSALTAPRSGPHAAAAASPSHGSSSGSSAGAVIVSLAYFGATHEIVTCTTDTIYTLQHNQREDPRVCDVDVVVAMSHAIREGSVGGRGSLLLQGPSRLTLWDVAGGYRTHLVDRALHSALPNARKEMVACCLDDLGNRVFLSLPDGSLEVHDLRAAFDTETLAGVGGDSVPLDQREMGRQPARSGVIVVGRRGPTITGSSASPAPSKPLGHTTEVVTELSYLSDQKLLCGTTTHGRLLLRSEDEANPFFTFACPAPTAATPLMHLSVSGDLGLVGACSSGNPVNGDHSLLLFPVSGKRKATTLAGAQGPEPATAPPTLSHEGEPGHRIYLYDYRHAGIAIHPPITIRVSRAVEGMTFLGALPVLLTRHDGGDVMLWSCPPVRGGLSPLVGFNVFTGGALTRAVSGGAVGPAVAKGSAVWTHKKTREERSAASATAPLSSHRPATVTRTEPSSSVSPEEAGIAHIPDAGTSLTCVAFDPSSHTLFFGDSSGQLHLYSLCPTIQAYGLQECQVEARRACSLRNNLVGASAGLDTLPRLVARRQLHGADSRAGDRGDAGHTAAAKTAAAAMDAAGIVALAWLPFLGALLSSGEDHRVLVHDVRGVTVGSLSAARLPLRGSGQGSSALPSDGACGALSPYTLPPRPQFRVERTLPPPPPPREGGRENGEAATCGHPYPPPASEDDACVTQGCTTRYFDETRLPSAAPSRAHSATRARDGTPASSLPPTPSWCCPGSTKLPHSRLGAALRRVDSSYGPSRDTTAYLASAGGNSPPQEKETAWPPTSQEEEGSPAPHQSGDADTSAGAAHTTGKGRSTREWRRRTHQLSGPGRSACAGSSGTAARSFLSPRDKKEDLYSDLTLGTCADQYAISQGGDGWTANRDARDLYRPKRAVPGAQERNPPTEAACSAGTATADVPDATAAAVHHLPPVSQPPPPHVSSVRKDIPPVPSTSSAVAPTPLAVLGASADAATGDGKSQQRGDGNRGTVLAAHRPVAAALHDSAADGGARTATSPTGRAPVKPGTSEALQLRVEEYAKELRRCLKGGGAKERNRRWRVRDLMASATPFS